jgi:HEAT repeat protein
MKGMNWIIMSALVGFLIAGLGIWHVATKEPAYQGRSLSSWLDEWGKSSCDRTNRAAFAIRAIGRNGVPILLAHFFRNKSTHEIQFWRSARKFIPDAWNPLYDNSTRESTAAEAINFLGTDAKSAFPTLTNLFFSRTRSNQLTPAIGLAGVGHEGVAVLLQTLTNQNWRLRFSAALALGEARSDLDKVIPALIETAKTKCSTPDDYTVCAQAAYALVRLHAKPELVVPVLLEFLTSPDADTRDSAARVLEILGADARAAVPLLLKARTDVNADVRRDAERALEMIDPQAASPRGP